MLVIMGARDIYVLEVQDPVKERFVLVLIVAVKGLCVAEVAIEMRAF